MHSKARRSKGSAGRAHEGRRRNAPGTRRGGCKGTTTTGQSLPPRVCCVPELSLCRQLIAFEQECSNRGPEELPSTHVLAP